MKRTIAPPWAIVRRSALNNAADTEEANDRTSLGDRSLPRQAPVDERSSPATHTHCPAGERSPSIVRSFAHGIPSFHVTYLGHGYHNPSFSQLSRTQLSRRPPSTALNHHKKHSNHHQTLLNHHPRHPSAPYLHIRPPHSSFFAPSSILPLFHNH
jgi:hypothetical protein